MCVCVRVCTRRVCVRVCVLCVWVHRWVGGRATAGGWVDTRARARVPVCLKACVRAFICACLRACMRACMCLGVLHVVFLLQWFHIVSVPPYVYT